MAELALGVLGLSGLFTAALEVWSFVDASRGFPESSGVFQSKLDLLRLRFILWGHNMGFRSPPGYDPALDDPTVRPTIVSTLKQIQRLLSNTDELSKTYGLDTRVRNRYSSQEIHKKTASALFYEDSRQLARISLRRRIEQNPTATNDETAVASGDASIPKEDSIFPLEYSASLWTRMSWAFKDQKKAEQLLAQLGFFLDGLDNVSQKLSLSQQPNALSTDIMSSRIQANRPCFLRVSQRDDIVKELGISVVYEPVHMAPVANIIFVHGLAGHAINTWTMRTNDLDGGPPHTEPPISTRKTRGMSRWFQKPFQTAEVASSPGSPSASTAVFWPTDLLSAECPDARIMILNYNPFEAANLSELAETLADKVNSSTRDCPCIFIAYSSGGLVVRRMLQGGHLHQTPVGLIFLGTPQQDIMSYFRGCIISEQMSNRFSSQTPSIESKLHDFANESTVFDSESALDDCIQIWSFHEAAIRGAVVPRSITTLGHSKEQVTGLRAKHSDMSRFLGFNDPNYIDIAAALQELCSIAIASKSKRIADGSTNHQQEPVQRMDAHHHNCMTTRDYLRLQISPLGCRTLTALPRQLHGTRIWDLSPDKASQIFSDPPFDFPDNLLDMLMIANCDRCKAKKIPCDATLPACKPCLEFKKDCVFTRGAKRWNPLAGYVAFASSFTDDVLSSLRFQEMDIRHASISTPASDTCRWILDHEMFKHWTDWSGTSKENGLLLLKGKPGSGKSMTMKYLSSFLSGRNEASVVVSVFFNARGTCLERSLIGLLRSVAHQIICSLPAALNSFEIHFQRAASVGNLVDHQWTKDELKECILGFINKTRSATRLIILIDAIEECNEKDVLETCLFIQRLAAVAAEARFPLKICISARPFPSIPLRVLPVIFIDKHNSDDIALFVQDTFSSFGLPENAAWSELRGELVRRSAGMFLWASLAVDKIVRASEAGFNIRGIRQQLDDIPDQLEEVFAHILSSNGSASEKDHLHSLRLFQWVIFSTTPLRLRDWRFILALIRTPGKDPYKSYGQWKRSVYYPSTDDDLIRQVRHLSKGLVDVNFSPEPAKGDAGDSIGASAGSLNLQHGETRLVQVIHESVREFFLKGAGFQHVGNFSQCRGQTAAIFTIITCCLDLIDWGDWDSLVGARERVYHATPTAVLGGKTRRKRASSLPPDAPVLQVNSTNPQTVQMSQLGRDNDGSVRSFESAGSARSHISRRSRPATPPANIHAPPQTAKALFPEVSPLICPWMKQSCATPESTEDGLGNDCSYSGLLGSKRRAAAIGNQPTSKIQRFQRSLDELDVQFENSPLSILGRFVAGFGDNEALQSTSGPPSLRASTVPSVKSIADILKVETDFLDVAFEEIFAQACQGQKVNPEESLFIALGGRLARVWPRLRWLGESNFRPESLAVFSCQLGIYSWIPMALSDYEYGAWFSSNQSPWLDIATREDLLKPRESMLLLQILEDPFSCLQEVPKWTRMVHKLQRDGGVGATQVRNYLNFVTERGYGILDSLIEFWRVCPLPDSLDILRDLFRLGLDPNRPLVRHSLGFAASFAVHNWVRKTECQREKIRDLLRFLISYAPTTETMNTLGNATTPGDNPLLVFFATDEKDEDALPRYLRELSEATGFSSTVNRSHRRLMYEGIEYEGLVKTLGELANSLGPGSGLFIGSEFLFFPCHMILATDSEPHSGHRVDLVIQRKVDAGARKPSVPEYSPGVPVWT